MLKFNSLFVADIASGKVRGKVDLSGNQIGPEGARALSNALQSASCHLTHLNLFNNQIGSEGAKALSNALQSPNCKLTDLSLIGNKIDSIGARALATALQSPNCKLTKLNLSSNKIALDGIRALSDALQSYSCRLTVLNLFYNQIDSDGTKGLSMGLRSPNCKLVELHYDKGKNAEADSIIEDIVEQNKQLSRLGFVGMLLLHSGVNRHDRSKYVELLKKNHLDSEVVWKIEGFSNTLRAIGIPVGDANRLLGAFESLSMQDAPGQSQANGGTSTQAFKARSTQDSSGQPQASDEVPTASPPDTSFLRRLSNSFKSLFNDRTEKPTQPIAKETDRFSSSGAPATSTLPLPKGKKYHVFASHAWGRDQKNHQHVSLLVKELERIGLKVWFDEQRLSGEIHRKISTGLDESFVYLACINQDFLEKIHVAGDKPGTDWCNYEFTAAIDTHGRALSMCVVCEPHLLDTKKWFGPVRTALGGLLYADYKDASKLTTAAQQIKNDVGELMGRLKT